MIRQACLGLAAALLLGGGSAALALDREAKKDALAEKLDGEMAEQNWKAAKKTSRELRRLCDAEERESLDLRIFQIDGELAWDKVRVKHEKSKKPSGVLKELRKFTKKFGEDDDFAERAEALEKTVLGPYVAEVQDFEGDLDDKVTGGSVVTDLKKEGEAALRWKDTTTNDESSLYVESETSNWSEYAYLTMWVHSSQVGSRLTIDAMTDVGHYYECWNNIDWTGWKHLRLPLQGRGARFGGRGRPTWSSIAALRFWKDEGKPIDIVIDDIRLEKPIP